MMNKIFVLLTIALLAAVPVLAADDDATSSAIKEKIKQRLEKTATESGQNTDQEMTQNVYYAWVGILTNMEEGKLIIKTADGERQATIDAKTVILQSEKSGLRKEIKAEKLKVGNLVIAIGKLEADTIRAVRVISSPATREAPTKKVVFGKVAEIEDEKITLKNGEKNILVLDKNTNLTISGVEKPTAVDIQLEDKVYAVVWQKDDKIISTASVFVIPGKYSPQATIQPSSEASASATPSASPKTKKSPTPSVEE